MKKGLYRIIPAKPEYPDVLSDIERAAATIFPTDVLSSELSHQTTSLPAFAFVRVRGMLWIAVSSDEKPIGFAMAEEHGTVLHRKSWMCIPSTRERELARNWSRWSASLLERGATRASA